MATGDSRHSVLWEPWEGRGLELLDLKIVEGSIFAESMVIGTMDGEPFGIRYRVRCDSGWKVREVEHSADEHREMKLSADGEGSWSADGERAPDLDGCIGVDVSVTPFTNTIPIRRLGLGPGESTDLAVAYVDVFGIRVKRAQQRYTCLKHVAKGRTYRYEAPESGFVAELQVDAEGLVFDYPEAFRRVHPAKQ